MKLTQKLLSFLHRVFDKDPAPFLALRLRYSGTGMKWTVSDALLTTKPVGGVGAALSIDLKAYTIGQLVNYLAAQPGYTVDYVDQSELSLLGATVLLDGSGDQDQSNGDHLYGYTNVLWSYLEANAVELEAAADQVEQMLLQMETRTASGVWLDELGSYYGVPRLQGEVDAPYSLRIIAEVLRPRGNNVAMEAAISAYTGQITKVIDVTLNTPLSPLYNGADTHNGVRFYNSTSSPLYGLFDVEYGYDIINGGDITSFAQIVRDLINRLRDAGTHLRALSLKGSELFDTATAPNDSTAMPLGIGAVLADTAAAQSESYSSAGVMASLQDSATSASESETEIDNYNLRYSGVRSYNGVVSYIGNNFTATPAQSLDLDFSVEGLTYSGLSCTRAGTATRWNASGVLEDVAANTLRISRDPATLKIGLQIEETRTNLHIWPRNLENAVYLKSGTSVTQDATTALDGTVTADKLVESTAASVEHLIQQSITVSAGAMVAYSVCAKAAGRNFVLVGFSGGGVGDVYVGVNLTTGAIVGTLGSPDSYSVTQLIDGWWRISCVKTIASTASLGARVWLSTNGSTIAYTGDGTSGAYIWHSQPEVGSFSTSIMPDGGATAVTRAADVVTQTLGAWFNSAEGTIYVQGRIPSPQLNYGQIFASLNDGTTNERIYLGKKFDSTTVLEFGVTDNGAGQAFVLVTPTSMGDMKVAGAYAQDNFAAAADGGAVSTDTSGTLPTPTQMNLGYLGPGGGTQYLNGRIYRLVYFPRALTSSDLKTITT